jgi:hypothetical protein
MDKHIASIDQKMFKNAFKAKNFRLELTNLRRVKHGP